MNRIEYRTLNDRAYERIRNELISGQFRPGQILVIRTLSDQFGVSTTPIREALQRLVGERQLVTLGNRSIAVPTLDHEQFSEVFRIRCALEGLAAELAAERVTRDGLNIIQQTAEDISDALKNGRFHEYVVLNQKFHFAVYEHANSPQLLDMIQDLWGQVGSYFSQLFESGGFHKKANDEHCKILKALEGRDAAGAREHTVADISEAAKYITPLLTSRARSG